MYSCHNHQLQLEMKLKSFFSICASVALLAAGTVHLRAQSLEPFNPYGIFSPSVEAWQMTRYGNLTPSLYTGAMTFSLPLYTYEDPDFTIPISLEYSFDGYRPAQHSGTVGYGWYLNCGGVITREVRGVPDEGVIPRSGMYACRVFGWLQSDTSRTVFFRHLDHLCSIHRFNVESPSSSDALGLYNSYDPFSDTPMVTFQTMNGYYQYDPAPDIWHFNFLGHTGDFLVMGDGSVRVFNSDIPHGELTIEFDGYYSPWSTAINIHSGDGYTYRFVCDGVSRSTDDLSAFASEPVESFTSWRLAEIKAPNGRYVTFERTHITDLSCLAKYDPILSGAYADETGVSIDPPYGDIQAYPAVRHSLVTENSSAVSGIFVHETSDSISASISLEYTPFGDESSINCFEYADAGQYFGTGAGKRLTSLTVKNRDGDTVEAWQFGYRLPDSGVPKCFLESATGMHSGKYTFSYDLSGRVLPPNDTQGTDHWGYWNGSEISDLRDHLRMAGFHEVEPGHTEIGPDSVEVVIPPVLEEVIVAHLYEQMSDDAKEPDASFAKCGALTRITYPTGGTSEIEYEGNLAHLRMNTYEATGAVVLEPEDAPSGLRPAGGVRVRSVTDTDFEGNEYETTFTYEDDEGECSGILMQMPKYMDYCSYDLLVPLSCSAHIYVTSFSNACGAVPGRNPHVVYSSVLQGHPDHSTTRHEFVTAADPGMNDAFDRGVEVRKRVMGNGDRLEEDPAVPRPTLVVVADRSPMRGRPKRDVTKDAAGTAVSVIEYTYGRDTTTVPVAYANSAYRYIFAPYDIVSPLTASRTETLHGVTSRTEYTYNSKGQVSSEAHISGIGATADTLRTDYTYLHESIPGTSLTSALSSASRTKLADGVAKAVAREDYEYGEWESGHNPRPTLIRRYSPDTGAVRETTITYNSNFCPMLLCMPGGATISYEWDGMNVSSRADNGPENKTCYDWKKLVGPTLITDPSGVQTSYMYDSHSRLQTVSDGLGNTVTEYNYKLKNE